MLWDTGSISAVSGTVTFRTVAVSFSRARALPEQRARDDARIGDSLHVQSSFIALCVVSQLSGVTFRQPAWRSFGKELHCSR